MPLASGSVFTVGEMLASPAQSAAVADAAPAGRAGAWIAAVGTSYSAGYAAAPAAGLALHRTGSDMLWAAVVLAGLLSAGLFGAAIRPYRSTGPGRSPMLGEPSPTTGQPST